MYKHRASLAGLLVFALLVSATPALARGPEVYAYPVWEGNIVAATTEESIHFYWGWIAVTKGLVRVFVNHSAETYVLTDSDGGVAWAMSADDADLHWGPILTVDTERIEGAYGADCPMPWVAGSWWEYVIPPLEAGIYTLEMSWDYEQPVNDGFHACKELPGTVPMPTPSLYRGGSIIISTIVVTAP